MENIRRKLALVGGSKLKKPEPPPSNYHHCHIPPFPEIGNGNHCSKSSKNSDGTGIGTICGYINYGLKVLCNGRNPYSDACLFGYERGHTASGVFFCYKINPEVPDLPGTICGRKLIYFMAVKYRPDYHSITELACGGYYPGRGACPSNYTLHHGRDYRNSNPRICGRAFIDTLTEIWFCSKN